MQKIAALAVGVALAVAAPAYAATSYPASDGSDACDFSLAGTYGWDTDTGVMSLPGGGNAPAGTVAGTLRVLNCTTLSIPAGVTLNITGSHAPDLRATGAIQINGTINVSAYSFVPGPGILNSSGATPGGSGTNYGGAGGYGGQVGRGGGGGGSACCGGGGGGGGGGPAGGGGGGTSAALGGSGGGPSGGPGGDTTFRGGQHGVGISGATDGGFSGGAKGGGGGGGSYPSSGPFQTGGGGGGGGGTPTTGSGSGGLGGGGGGTVRLISPVSVTLGSSSLLKADGAFGFATSSDAGGGGGGAGGSLQMIAPTVAIPAGASLSARGGLGGTSAGGPGGNGGPGRIDIAANTLTNAGASVPAANTGLYSANLSVAKAGSGAGTLSSSPGGISCGADCGEDYDPNAVVTLTATPAAGSAFTGWSGCDSTVGATCTVNVDANKTATANFTALRTLTAAKSGTGSGTITSTPAGIDCGATCTHSYDDGTLVTLTAAPAVSSTFTGWSGGGCSGTATCTVSMSADLSVTAAFSANQPPDDTTPPDTAITKVKVNSKKRQAKLEFTSTETGSTFECKLDKKPFKGCTSPTTYKKPDPGKHKFNVVATDKAGNADPTPAVAKFKIKN